MWALICATVYVTGAAAGKSFAAFETKALFAVNVVGGLGCDPFLSALKAPIPNMSTNGASTTHILEAQLRLQNHTRKLCVTADPRVRPQFMQRAG
jgi:hypothetical protein